MTYPPTATEGPAMPNPTLRRTTVYTLTVPAIPLPEDLDADVDTLAAAIQAAAGPGTPIVTRTWSRVAGFIQVAWRSATDDAAARATAAAVTSDPAAVLHTGFGIHRRVL